MVSLCFASIPMADGRQGPSLPESSIRRFHDADFLPRLTTGDEDLGTRGTTAVLGTFEDTRESGFCPRDDLRRNLRPRSPFEPEARGRYVAFGILLFVDEGTCGLFRIDARIAGGFIALECRVSQEMMKTTPRSEEARTEKCLKFSRF